MEAYNGNAAAFTSRWPDPGVLATTLEPQLPVISTDSGQIQSSAGAQIELKCQ